MNANVPATLLSSFEVVITKQHKHSYFDLSSSQQIIDKDTLQEHQG